MSVYYFIILLALLLPGVVAKSVFSLLGFLGCSIILLANYMLKLKLSKIKRTIVWLYIWMALLLVFYLLRNDRRYVNSIIEGYIYLNISFFSAILCYHFLLFKGIKKIDNIMSIMLFSVLFVTLLCIIEHYSSVDLYSALKRTRYVWKYKPTGFRVRATLEHPALFSYLSVQGFSISLAYSLFRRKDVKYILLCILSLFAVFFSQVRAGILSCSLVFIIYAIIFYHYLKINNEVNREVKRKLILSIVLVVVAVILIPTEGKPILFQIIGLFQNLNTSNTISVTHRINAIKTVLGILFKSNNISNILFGSGYRMFTSSAMDKGVFISAFSSTIVDNQLVSFLYDIGVVNTILFVIIYVKNIKRTIQIVGNNTENINETLYSVISGTNLVIGIFTMFFFDTYGWLIPVFTQGMWFGICFFLRDIKRIVMYEQGKATR